MLFSDLQRGDVFRLASIMRSDSYEKTGDHRARIVNSAETRNVADDELVYLECTAADRAGRVRGLPPWYASPGNYYQDEAGWHRKHDLYGGPPGQNTEQEK
jgi:hypothetical protein